MNPIFSYNRGLDYSYLFGSGTFKINSIDTGISFQELNLVKSGSLKKITESYYDKKKIISGIKKSEFPKEKYKKLSNVKSFSKALQNTSEHLIKTDFSDKETTLFSVKAFLTSYNNLIESSDETDQESILRREVIMTGRTASYTPFLQEVGIEIEKGNTLKIDDSKFLNADVSKLEELFKGRLNFTGRVKVSATAIADIAANKMNSINKTYTRAGTYYNFDYATRIFEAV